MLACQIVCLSFYISLYLGPWMQFSLRPLLSALPFITLSSYIPSPFLFRKEQTSHGYQVIAYQLALRLGNSSLIKARKKGPQIRQQSETVPDPTVLTKGTSYKTLPYMQRSMQAPWLTGLCICFHKLLVKLLC